MNNQTKFDGFAALVARDAINNCIALNSVSVTCTNGIYTATAWKTKNKKGEEVIKIVIKTVKEA